MRSSEAGLRCGERFYFMLLAILMLGINLTMVACGENSPAPNATTNVAPTQVTELPITPTASAGPTGVQATSTPVIIATAAQTAASAVNLATAAVTRTALPTISSTTSAAVATTDGAGITPVPTLTLAPAPSGYTGKLSIVGNDNAIYVLRFDGKPPQAVLGKAGQVVNVSSDGEIFFWPTWSKDGSKLAAYGVNVLNGNPTTSDTFVVNADGSGLYKVQDQTHFAPVFLSWSPDGNFLSILLNKDTGLELNVADTSKNAVGRPATLRPVVSGGPIFSHWSSDSDSLLVRAGDGDKIPVSVGLFHAKSAVAKLNPISAKAGSFRAPSFSADGKKLAFSTSTLSSDSETLNVQTKDGVALAIIPLEGSSPAFAFSPDGTKIAHSYALSSSGSYKGIGLNDISTADKGVVLKPTQVVSDPILAFWWSPDGKKLAYIGGNDTGDALTWNIYDLDTKKTSKLTEWIPSREVFQLIAYFDQYALSDSIWSPDSKTLVFTGFAGQNMRADSGKPSGDPVTYLLPVSGPNAGKPQAIEPGKLAFWTK